ncbi:MAG: DNA alkylation repair protein [Oscillospiraceae bacterium]|nr:DNA alkylation repair protein [Oscillospiraceae bacterium]
MPDLLKDMYNPESIQKLASDIRAVYPAFQTDTFLTSVLDETWSTLELKARGRQISIALGKYLPADYSEAIGIIDQIVMNYGTWLDGFFAMVFPDFVEVHGQDEAHWDISLAALERYTQYASAEFAVRPFLIQDQDRMMAQMAAWSKHENDSVRRLASEGCRPALPWGQALNSFKQDPTPILPILEQLKTDPSIWVRKSVANNLNDISKTHPDLVATLAKKWSGKHEHTDWIIKHGCRTLLKQGNRAVLALFGYDGAASVDIQNLTLEASSISRGESIAFSFSLTAKEPIKVRLEYGVDYVKANGKRSRKIFQISEVTCKKNEQRAYTRNHSFADVSVRKHYPGLHSITLIVNGIEQGTLDFELRAD